MGVLRGHLPLRCRDHRGRDRVGTGHPQRSCRLGEGRPGGHYVIDQQNPAAGHQTLQGPRYDQGAGEVAGPVRRGQAGLIVHNPGVTEYRMSHRWNTPTAEFPCGSPSEAGGRVMTAGSDRRSSGRHRYEQHLLFRPDAVGASGWATTRRRMSRPGSGGSGGEGAGERPEQAPATMFLVRQDRCPHRATVVRNRVGRRQSRRRRRWPGQPRLGQQRSAAFATQCGPSVSAPHALVREDEIHRCRPELSRRRQGGSSWGGPARNHIPTMPQRARP